MEQEERLSLLQWTLERQLHWINSADTKAGALIAVYVAATATAATLLNDVDPTALEKALILISGFSALPGVLLAIAVFFPRIEGPKDSVFFFGGIKALGPAPYAARIDGLTIPQALQDLAAQISVNAEIACGKHALVRLSMCWAAICMMVCAISILTAMAAT